MLPLANMPTEARRYPTADTQVSISEAGSRASGQGGQAGRWTAVAADKWRGRLALQGLRHRSERDRRPNRAEQRQKHGAEPRESGWARPLGRGEEATLAARRRGDSLTARPAWEQRRLRNRKMPCGGPREGTGGRQSYLTLFLSHTHTLTYMHTLTRVHTHMLTHACAHTHWHTHTCSHRHIRSHTHTLSHTHIHGHTHIHTRSHTYIHSHTHAYTHIHSPW